MHDTPASLPVLAQFLIYPTTGDERATASKAEFAEGHFLTQASIDWFNSCYAAPPADPLRDEGRSYAAALIEAGVATIYQEAVGNIHGFFGAAAAIPSASDDVRKALGALRQMIATS